MAKSVKKVAKKVVKSPAKSKGGKAVNPKSFHLLRESDKFVSFKFTKQTVYWIVLLAYIVFMDIWISNAQVNALMLVNSL